MSPCFHGTKACSCSRSLYISFDSSGLRKHHVDASLADDAVTCPSKGLQRASGGGEEKELIKGPTLGCMHAACRIRCIVHRRTGGRVILRSRPSPSPPLAAPRHPSHVSVAHRRRSCSNNEEEGRCGQRAQLVVDPVRARGAALENSRCMLMCNLRNCFPALLTGSAALPLNALEMVQESICRSNRRVRQQVVAAVLQLELVIQLCAGSAGQAVSVNELERRHQRRPFALTDDTRQRRSGLGKHACRN